MIMSLNNCAIVVQLFYFSCSHGITQRGIVANTRNGVLLLLGVAVMFWFTKSRTKIVEIIQLCSEK